MVSSDIAANASQLVPEVLFESFLFIETSYPLPNLESERMLLHLMEARNMKQEELVGVIGSRGVVSEIVNGKRSISKAQAKVLGKLFHVSPSLFI